MELVHNVPACTLCGSDSAQLVNTLKEKPAKETDFGIPDGDYLRMIYQCSTCSVYFSRHALLADGLYSSRYNEATYARDLLTTYKRIRALPEAESDNKQRVRRVVEFHAKSGKPPNESHMLDVGSGLCVFLAEMSEHGFHCHAVDPDKNAVAHAIRHAGVEHGHAGVLGDFDPNGRLFDVITFNKVLEHVVDPIRLLKLSASFLMNRGFVYLELPDGEAALRHDDIERREEFYIEHETTFTQESTRWLIRQAGLQVAMLQSIHEPSDKYTVYAFATLRDADDEG